MSNILNNLSGNGFTADIDFDEDTQEVFYPVFSSDGKYVGIVKDEEFIPEDWYAGYNSNPLDL